ncbi:MAG: response regulator [Desulfobulbaceae bacterium]|nr:response regulator [Desulfobulbaceae bacterium]
MSDNKKIRVLLADDEVHIRVLMKRVLESMGVEVVAEAKNGQEAVDLYREKRPHMTFLDINMPLKDGTKALKEIKAEFPEAFVIMLTSLSAMETVKECIAAGAANYIRKDTPLNELKLFVKESWDEYRNSLKK